MGQNMLNIRRSTFKSRRRVLIILPLKKVLFSKPRMERTDLEEHQRNQENMKIMKILMCIIGNFALFFFFNLYLIHLHWKAPSCALPANFNLLTPTTVLLLLFQSHMKPSDVSPLGFIGVFLEVFRDVHFWVKY